MIKIVVFIDSLIYYYKNRTAYSRVYLVFIYTHSEQYTVTTTKKREGILIYCPYFQIRNDHSPYMCFFSMQSTIMLSKITRKVTYSPFMITFPAVGQYVVQFCKETHFCHIVQNKMCYKVR